jgi:hypothetical protein
LVDWAGVVAFFEVLALEEGVLAVLEVVLVVLEAILVA